MLNVSELRQKDDDIAARRTIAKIESLLSRSNQDRLKLFIAMKQYEAENVAF